MRTLLPGIAFSTFSLKISMAMPAGCGGPTVSEAIRIVTPAASAAPLIVVAASAPAPASKAARLVQLLATERTLPPVILQTGMCFTPLVFFDRQPGRGKS